MRRGSDRKARSPAQACNSILLHTKHVHSEAERKARPLIETHRAEVYEQEIPVCVLYLQASHSRLQVDARIQQTCLSLGDSKTLRYSVCCTKQNHRHLTASVQNLSPLTQQSSTSQPLWSRSIILTSPGPLTDGLQAPVPSLVCGSMVTAVSVLPQP